MPFGGRPFWRYAPAAAVAAIAVAAALELAFGRLGDAAAVASGGLVVAALTLFAFSRIPAAKALRESEDRFRRLSDASFEGIVIHDGKQILDVNDAFARLTGYAAGELIGREPLSILAPESREAARRDAESGFNGLREYVGLRKDGTAAPIECQARPVVWNGRPARVVAIRDMTERTRAEKALRESEARYRRIVDTASEGVSQLDADFRVIFVNARACQILGYGPEEVIGVDVRRFMADDERQDSSRKDENRRRGIAETYERKLIRKDGSTLRVLVSATPILDAEGRFAGSFAMFTDITERTRAEQALREREDLYRRILDTSLDSIVLTDLEGRILMANRAAEESYGRGGRGSLDGEMGFGLVAGEDRDKVLARMSDLIEKGEVRGVNFGATRSDGTHYPAEINASLVKDASGQPVGIVGIVRDVTDRVRVRENLARTGALLDSIRDAQSLYIAEHDPRPVFDALLETLLRMTDSEHGFVAEALRDEKDTPTTRILAWDKDSARRFEAMEKQGAAYRDLHNLAGDPVLTGKLVICNDVPNRPGALKLPEGHPPLRAFMGVPLFFGGDLVGVACVSNRPGGYDERIADFLKPFTSTVAGLIHAVRVAREERAAHAAVRESERRFREMMENVRLLAVTLDRDGRVTFCNNRLAEFAGWSREELVGRDWFETFIPEGQRDGMRAVHREVIAGESFAAHHENEVLTRTGERRRIAWDNTTLRDADGRIVGAASLGRDVTQQRELEDQVRQSQKMEAVGRLAGGVAHDLNNMLAPIMGWAELLLLDMTADDPRRDDLLHVRVAAERARDLTRQLLAFSRKQVLQLRPVRLADVVTGFEKMLRRTIREDIHIHLLLHEDSGAVLADVGQIEQVLANLAVNAQDALPTGGEMTVEVSNVDLDDAWVLAHPGASPGAFVRLTVADTGIGMPPQVREHLFEPFFTTKDVGQGTGLGLATVYGIVRQHGGVVDVESEPGHGSTFRIDLPRVDVPAQSPEEKASSGALQGGRESILVVEDNEMVRELTCEMLRARGYAVTGAASPEECIEAVEARRERVDLLVTDLIMPHINGRDLYERLTATIPALRVVVMSGYTDTLLASAPGSRFGRHFLQKPFGLRALTDTVRAALDETG